MMGSPNEKDGQTAGHVCSRCGHELTREAATTRTSREVRKRVTVLFADIRDSTSLTERLDAEVADFVAKRFHRTAREVLERYGATVEAQGDGVKAIFGLPRLHEDDAVHAVCAAADLNDALLQLNEQLERRHQIRIDLHTGVHTGEIVTTEGATTGSDDRLAHTISVSYRLMEAARTNDIVISRTTYELVREVVEAEPLPPQRLKGLKGPTAWRLLSIRSDAAMGPSRSSTPLIGRDPELAALRSAYDRAVYRQIWRLAKVLGDAGVGRSSLVDEFTRTLTDNSEFEASPLVLWGRCLSYLSDIRAGPISQILRQAAGIQRDHNTEEARRRLSRLVGHDEALLARVAPLLGLPGSPGRPEDIWRALRRLFELLASGQPLVLVIDDLHAAPPILLRILEELAAGPPGAAVLLICTIRSESLESLGDWSARLPEVDSFRTPELTVEEAHRLIAMLLPGPEPDREVIERIARHAHGNPLRIKEFIASLSENGDPGKLDALTIEKLTTLRPAANLEAVLDARLEGLPSAEQTIVEGVAVIGAAFTAGEVSALCPILDSDVITSALRALERKELVVLEAGQDRFALRVRYREAAYRRLTKQRRIELHMSYANWLENGLDGLELPELDVRIGLHLDAAYRYRRELEGELDPLTVELARRAGEHLAVAGRSHLMRLFPDTSTASWLERATELLPRHFPSWRRAVLDLADLLQEEQPDRALVLYEKVMEAAVEIGDRSIEQHAILGRMEVSWFRNFQGDWNKGCEEVSSLLHELTDSPSRAKAWRLLAHAYAAAGRAKDAVGAVKEASRIVHETVDLRLEAKILELACIVLFWGPTQLESVISEIQHYARWAEDHGLYDLQASALSILSRATAMQGDFGRARDLLQQTKSIRPARRDLLTIGTDSISEGLVELLDSQLEVAARVLLQGYEWLRERDARVAFASVAVMLARVQLYQGHDDEAERTTLDAKNAAVETHFDAQIKWRSLQAIIYARQGEHGPAEQLAREAAALGEKSGQPDSQAEALMDLAEVLERIGHPMEAMEAARRALHIYEWRGSTFLADRVRQVLARLEG